MQPFQSKISNDETAALPAAAFSGRIVVVENNRLAVAACRELSQAQAIGFDTETRPSFKAGVVNRVSLLQLSTLDCCYLFRLNRIRFDRPLARLLENPEILKIGVAVSGDLHGLHQLKSFREAGFVELQSMVGQWGVEEKSLRKMSAVVLGERVSKAQRLSNWEAASLTKQQQLYAATDAWVCLRIYDKLIVTPKNS